jgi:hypothetical protein
MRFAGLRRSRRPLWRLDALRALRLGRGRPLNARDDAALDIASLCPIPLLAASFFKDCEVKRPIARTLTWRKLVERLLHHDRRPTKDGACWSPVAYRAGTTRKKDHVEAISCFVGDFDHTTFEDLAEVKARLVELGLAAVIHSTFSNAPPDDVRFRVVVPFSAPVAAEEWGTVWDQVDHHLFRRRADPSTKDASHIYYLPSAPPDAPDEAVFVEVLEGAALDPTTLPPAPLAERTNGRARVIEDVIPAGERNATLASLAGTRRARGMSAGAIAAALTAENATRCDPPLPDDEVRRIAASIGRYDPAAPRNAAANDRHDPDAVDLSALELLSAPELLNLDLPPLRWAVDEVLPEGLTMLVGKPKIGKSWAVLGLAVAVALGGRALGHIAVEQGEVLYLALEDGKRRLKTRLQAMLGTEAPAPGLTLATRWRRLDQGGLALLDRWLDAHPQARLVIVDTFVRVRGAASRRTQLYQEDYDALAGLHELASRRGVAILVVHHSRKMTGDDVLDEISGTTGLAAAVDTVLVLKRERGRADATLFLTGRDLEQEREVALKWDPRISGWALLGDAAEYRQSQERTDVIRVLRSGPASPKDVSEQLDKNYSAVKKLMWSMARAEDPFIEAVNNGRYRLRARVGFENPVPGYPVTPDMEYGNRPHPAPVLEKAASGYPVTPVTDDEDIDDLRSSAAEPDALVNDGETSNPGFDALAKGWQSIVNEMLIPVEEAEGNSGNRVTGAAEIPAGTPESPVTAPVTTAESGNREGEQVVGEQVVSGGFHGRAYNSDNLEYWRNHPRRLIPGQGPGQLDHDDQVEGDPVVPGPPNPPPRPVDLTAANDPPPGWEEHWL